MDSVWLRMENQKGVLFDDIFEVVDVDPDGKKFDKGEHLVATQHSLACQGSGAWWHVKGTGALGLET